MNTLAQICADKAGHVAAMRELHPLREIERKIAAMPPPRGFLRRLRSVAESGANAVIAEFKRASPSKGLIRPSADPAAIVRAYEKAGAACLSVLTDSPYFQGSDTDFLAARGASSLPMIRKDFMIDPYQIHESRALGADCVLLIMAALSDERARTLLALARALGMDALIEIHDDAELERALALGPDLVGINSRNLKTLEVNLQTAVRLSAGIPAEIFKVAESGIQTRADLKTLHRAGFRGFLIGESLMREPDVEAALRVMTDPVRN